MYNVKNILTLAFIFSANALPTNGTVESGAASILIKDNFMLVEQSTASATIDWQTFNIATDEKVHISQPDNNSILTARVSNHSVINGSLSANGQLYFTTPSGIVISETAAIDVPSLYINAQHVQSSGNVYANSIDINADKVLIDGILTSPDLSIEPTVRISANTIDIHGVIDASTSSIGGQVLVSASEKLTVAGTIKAEGRQGGLVALGSPQREISGDISVRGESNGFIYSGANRDYALSLRNPYFGQKPLDLYHFESLDGGKSFISSGIKSPGVFTASEAILYSEDNSFALNNVVWKGEGELNSYSNHYNEYGPLEHNPHFSQIKASDVFDGVDLIYYYNNRGELEHDMVVAPNADISNISWKITGAELKDGSIVKGDFEQLPPLTYQQHADYKNIIESKYEPSKDGFGITVAEYDSSKPLIIDPVTKTLAYYRNGVVTGTTRDPSIFVLCNDDIAYFLPTNQTSMPTQDPGKNFFNSTGSQTLLAVFNSDATELRYATYLGNNRLSGAFLDSGPGAYYLTTLAGSDIAGVPASAKEGVFNSTFSAVNSDAVVFKFENDGTLDKMSYIRSDGNVNPRNILYTPDGIYLSSTLDEPNITGFAAGTNPFVATEQASGDTRSAVSRISLDLSSITTRVIDSGDAARQVPLARDSNGKINIAARVKNNLRLDNGTVAENDGAFLNSGTQTHSVIIQIEPDENMTPRWAHSYSRGAGSGLNEVSAYTLAVDENDNIIVSGRLLGYSPGNFLITDGALNSGSRSNSVYFRSYSKDGELLTSARYSSNGVSDPLLSEISSLRSAPRMGLITVVSTVPFPADVDVDSEVLIGLTPSDTFKSHIFKYSEDYKTIEKSYVVEPGGSTGPIDVSVKNGVLYVNGHHTSGRQINNTINAIPGFTSLTSNGSGIQPYLGVIDFEDVKFWGVTSPVCSFTSSISTTQRPVSLPANVLSVTITTQDSKKIIIKSSFRNFTSPDLVLSDALTESNISVDSIRDVSIDDGKGIWIYENGKWRYRRR